MIFANRAISHSEITKLFCLGVRPCVMRNIIISRANFLLVGAKCSITAESIPWNCNVNVAMKDQRVLKLLYASSAAGCYAKLAGHYNNITRSRYAWFTVRLFNDDRRERSNIVINIKIYYSIIHCGFIQSSFISYTIIISDF